MSRRVADPPRRWKPGGLVLLALAALAVAAPAAAHGAPGAARWEREWVPGTGYLSGVCTAVAPNGNVFVGGLLNGGGYAKSFEVSCYKPDGTLVWSRSAPLTATSCGLAGMAADGKGGVVLTGYANSFDGPTSWVTCRWSGGGALKYQQSLNLQGARAADVACDGAGNAYVAGTVGLDRAVEPFADWCVVKYDATGATVWSRTYDRAGMPDAPLAVARDGDGRIYVAGNSQSSAGAQAATVLKFAPGGKRLWKRTWAGPSGAVASAGYGVAASAVGCAVCGYVSDAGAKAHPFVVRYTPTGRLAWARTYRYKTQDEGVFDAVAIDRGGRVVVAGRRSLVTPRDWDYLVARYKAGGGLQWTRVRSYSESHESVEGIALDRYDNVFVTGVSGYPPNGPEPDCLTWSLKPTGASRWFKVRSHMGFCAGRDLAVTGTAAYVAGDQGDGGWFLIKYAR